MKLFQKMSLNKARCLLCPRYCELEDTQIGKCRGRINLNGEIHPCNWGVVSSIAIEPIEKKPFKHFMPGTKTFSVGGFGCNLECRYCENTQVSQNNHGLNSHHFTPQDIITGAKEKHCKSVCMTYNEPTIAIEYLLRVGHLCHLSDLKFIIKTNAYINGEPWEEVCKIVDAMNIDYKGAFQYFEDVTVCRYTDFGEKIYAALDADVHVELSIPILPGYNNDGYYFHPLAQYCSEVGIEIPCHLLKIHPAHLMIDSPATSDGDIAHAREDLKYIFKDIYV